MSYANGFATDANSGGLTSCTGLAATAGVNPTFKGTAVSCTAAVNVKTANFLYENGGAGMISADAEYH
jgi:hypothetical protein